MKRAITYDITRLISRILNRTPNGIDRVDIAYAQHFLSSPHTLSSAMVHLGPLGHRVVGIEDARSMLDGIMQHFGEDREASDTALLNNILTWLTQPRSPKPKFKRITKRRPPYWKLPLFYHRHIGGLGSSPLRRLPDNCVYLCVSQYPLAKPLAFEWLKQRPDIKPVFFLHDMLPLEFPEYFRPDEQHRHITRLQNMAQVASGILVSTQHVKAAAQKAFAALGRHDLPVHVSPVPMAQSFQRKLDSRPKVSRPYFVCCGTIEPRKNHLLLLNLWRELAQDLGDATPKLLLIGARGWENENILDMLDRSPAIREHVLELNNLTTPDMVSLMHGASALLMPSFGEGLGLPVAEALAIGARVIASDIPPFREIADSKATLLSPLNGQAWKTAILATMGQKSETGSSNAANSQVDFAGVDMFLDQL